MSETFNVIFQAGFFKVLNDDERKKLANFCTRHKGKLGTIVVEEGFHIECEAPVICKKCGHINRED